MHDILTCEIIDIDGGVEKMKAIPGVDENEVKKLISTVSAEMKKNNRNTHVLVKDLIKFEKE